MARAKASSGNVREADFIAFFNALWYQDFPVLPDDSIGRANWTIHIGVCVRRCADLLGWRALFEEGKRTDAVIKDADGAVRIAMEWEWIQAFRESVNEIEKLRDGAHDLSAFFTYSREDHHEKNMERIQALWTTEKPLVLFVITFTNPKSRHFHKLQTYRVVSGRATLVRQQPALPWEVQGSRWAALAAR